MKQVSIFLFLVSVAILPEYPAFSSQTGEQGTLSIYFMNEQVGYEEFEWNRVERGYELVVSGRMTKPIPIQIEKMVIQISDSFIPHGFSFIGTISGMKQSVKSEISDGHVINVIQVSGQKQSMKVDIKRDAFLLPNPVFSAYMAITKKFRCSLKEEKQLSAYIIPQTEIPFVLKPVENAPCRLHMEFSSSVIVLETNPQGRLLEVRIPSQNLVAKLD